MLEPNDVMKVDDKDWEQFKKEAVRDELYYSGPGDLLDTPEGRGTVVELDLMRQRVKVRMEENPDTISQFANTDIAVLRSAEIERADTVVSVTNDDNTNIMVAQIARNVYHIPNVICRLYDPEREIVYKEFGIDTICPTVLSTREIDRLLGKAKDILQLVSKVEERSPITVAARARGIYSKHLPQPSQL